VSSQYDHTVHPRQAMIMCENGAVDREIAEMFDISPSTFYQWRNKYPEFAAALAVGKEAADDRVERSLYNRAVGYSYDSEKLVTVSQGQNMGSVVERHQIVEHVPPDVKAATRWLEARRPKVWGRTLGIKFPEAGNGEDEFAGMTDEQRAKVREGLELLANATRGDGAQSGEG
jgi:hypothetical protein